MLQRDWLGVQWPGSLSQTSADRSSTGMTHLIMHLGGPSSSPRRQLGPRPLGKPFFEMYCFYNQLSTHTHPLSSRCRVCCASSPRVCNCVCSSWQECLKCFNCMTIYPRPSVQAASLPLYDGKRLGRGVRLTLVSYVRSMVRKTRHTHTRARTAR